jgi:IPT/TIG domain
VVRRLALLVPFLMLLVPGLSPGADNFPPRQIPVKSPPPAAQAEAVKVPPIAILSIIPAQGEPGMTVTLYGNGFSEKTSAFLANLEITTVLVGQQQITFDIPKLDPGLYALFLKREDGMTSRAYNFTILPQKPVVTSLSPDSVNACSTGIEREVIVSGRNFKESSHVMFDGAAVRSRFSSPETISFMTPQVAGGLHQVQVKNSEDAVSGVLGLVIDARPEITGVLQGEDSVNYYNLIVEGRNFQQNSALVITEDRSIDQAPSQLVLDVKRISSGMSSATEREQTAFINCNRIIYRRSPYSTSPKNLRVQVVNPDGGESSVVSVSAP